MAGRRGVGGLLLRNKLFQAVSERDLKRILCDNC